MIWIPVFDKNEKEEIENIIFKIAKFSRQNKTTGLHQGNAGISIFYGYLYLITKDKKFLSLSKKFLTNSLISISTTPMTGAFCNGVSGICWAYKHSLDMGLTKGEFENVIGPEVDTFLIKFSDLNLKNGSYDFLYEGLGSVLYLIEREVYSEKVRYLISSLNSSRKKGTTDSVWTYNREDKNIEYNLGLAHGIPSILFILCLACRHKIDSSSLSKQIHEISLWLLSHKIPNSISNFPSYITNDDIRKNSRLGWCYGDLGIATVIYYAGETIGNKSLKSAAIDIMIDNIKRKETNESGVSDAFFCHGSVGIAHIYNRFYQQTKIEEFKINAKFWYHNSLKCFDSVEVNSMREPNISHQYESGLITGIHGIGLALISSIYDIEPKWDRCFLLS